MNRLEGLVARGEIVLSEPEKTPSRSGFPYSLVSVALLLLTVAVATGALLFRAPLNATIHGPFERDTASASQMVYASVPASRLGSVTGDTNEGPAASRLRLWIDGREIAPAHTPHDTLRGGGAGFSHWGDAVYFVLPPGLANDATTEIRLTAPTSISWWLLVLPLLPAGLAAAFAYLALAQRARRTSRSVAELLFSFSKTLPAQVACNLVLVTLAISTMALMALDAGVWRNSETISGPFAREAAPGSYAYQLTPKEPGCCFRIPTDSMASGAASDLQLTVNGTAISPAHVPHADLRGGQPGFSHWMGTLVFTLPPGTANDAASFATITYSLRPPAYVTWISLFAVLACLTLFHGPRALNWLGDEGSESRHTGLTAKPQRLWPYRWVIAGGLLILYLAVFWPLREPDLEFAFEADFNPRMIAMWREFLSEWGGQPLLKPASSHPYLDGQFIFYGFLAWFLEALVAIIPALKPMFPNQLSFDLGAAVFGNIAAYGLAGVFYFLALHRLTRSLVIAAIAATATMLAPQMLDINIVRVDYLNTWPLAAIFYCSVVIAQREASWRHAILLGLAMAFAGTIKINGLFYGIMPALATIAAMLEARRWDFRRHTGFTLVAFAVFLVAFAVLMGRFIYFLSAPEILAYYRDTITDLNQWQSVAPVADFYYNIYLMEGHGTPFVALYLICGAAVAALAMIRRKGGAIFLAAGFLLLSLASELALRHSRGGYHLLPFFFGAIAYVAAEILRWRPAVPMQKFAPVAKIGLVALIGVIVATSVPFVAKAYEVRATEMASRISTVQELKREPRVWLASNTNPQTRVCILRHSDWTVPPVDGLAIEYKYGPLDIPYLDRTATRAYAPPSPEQLRAECDVVVISDLHRIMYLGRIAESSAQRSNDWEQFFARLDSGYRRHTYRDEAGIMTLRQIDIYDLRE